MKAEYPSNEKALRRKNFGVIGGYIGFFFGLLAIVSTASETADWLPLGQAAAVVLANMIGGYVLGWLVQPLIARLFPNAWN